MEEINKYIIDSTIEELEENNNFIIDNDEKAEWAIKKIAEERAKPKGTYPFAKMRSKHIKTKSRKQKRTWTAKQAILHISCGGIWTP